MELLDQLLEMGFDPRKSMLAAENAQDLEVSTFDDS
jgi:hypothetical protein